MSPLTASTLDMLRGDSDRLVNLGDAAERADTNRRILDGSPDDPMARTRLATALEDLGDWDAAVVEWQLHCAGTSRPEAEERLRSAQIMRRATSDLRALQS